MWSETIGYRQYRHPYLPRFFAGVAQAIPLTGKEDLLDLGCGAGEVALGFAPFVASLTGVDLEQPMLEEAAKQVRAHDRQMRLIRSKVEDAPEDLGSFHLITMGRSHWFMHTPAVLARLDRWLLPRGHILVCRPLLNPDRAEWQSAYQSIRRKWAHSELRELLKLTADEYFQGTQFVLAKRIVARGRRRLGLQDLINRTLGTPGTTRGVLGPEGVNQMIAEIRASMAPYFSGGPILENHVTMGFLYRRRQES